MCRPSFSNNIHAPAFALDQSATWWLFLTEGTTGNLVQSFSLTVQQLTLLHASAATELAAWGSAVSEYVLLAKTLEEDTDITR